MDHISLRLTVCILIAVHQASGATLICENNGCNCACEGQPVIYECRITDRNVVTTVWKGTIFDCLPHNEISLAHALYTRGVSGNCNSGSITASSLPTDESTFTSVLNITRVNNRFDKGTIRCAESDGSQEGNFSEMTLSVISSSSSHFQADETEVNVFISKGQLLFSWSSLAPGCPYLSYRIQSSNCGSCLNGSVVNTTNVTCTDLTTDGRNCSLTVTPLATVCGNISGRSSNLRKITLKVPEVKDIEAIPHYSSEGNLTALTTTFSQSAKCSLTDGIDDDSVNYTVTYYDAFSTFMCLALQVNPSNCSEAHCSVLVPALNLSKCSGSRDISVVIYASNILGQGPQSMPLVRESINTFVNVSYDHASRSIVCVFWKGYHADIYMCNVTLAMASSKMSCDAVTSGSLYSSDSANGTVYVTLGNIQNNKLFCYAVLASDGNYSAIIHGDFIHRESNSTPTIIGGSISAVLLFLLLMMLIPLAVICIKKNFRRKFIGCCKERVKSKESHFEKERAYKDTRAVRAAAAPENERGPVASVDTNLAPNVKIKGRPVTSHDARGPKPVKAEPATVASIRSKENAKKESNVGWIPWFKSFF